MLRAAKYCGRPSPMAPSVPICKKSRRVVPSHVWDVPREVKFSMILSWLVGVGAVLISRLASCYSIDPCSDCSDHALFCTNRAWTTQSRRSAKAFSAPSVMPPNCCGCSISCPMFGSA